MGRYGGGDEDDDDEPFTQEDLEAIDAAFQSASKRPRRGSASVVNGGSGHCRRRLPNSIVALQRPGSFSLTPCQANAKMRYPVMKFSGQIRYSRTTVEVERAAIELLKAIEEKRSKADQVAIGFDIEWKATFRKGASPGKAAVMQICVDPKQCHVMHIIHSGVPKILKLLLEDSMLLKVGVGIGNDAVKIFKDYNVSIEAAEELGYLANQKLGGDSQKWSLASLTENFVSKQLAARNTALELGNHWIYTYSIDVQVEVFNDISKTMQLLKPKKIQLGNWEANILSRDQLEYAATDAFASWYLYEVLKTLPDVQTVDAGHGEEVKDVSPQLS